jgi:hypothetical protein
MIQHCAYADLGSLDQGGYFIQLIDGDSLDF